MSEISIQLNEEIIKGQLKELLRSSVEETLNELHACSKKFEFYCLTSREPRAALFLCLQIAGFTKTSFSFPAWCARR